ncbi:hypothetical protein RvY_00252-2 [Ramazzottius varieornatus]|uniref:G-protein coupled receptors family 1 profile domain-containing protein n=1 Tax=Ramazzottius varieornatus TaxID=947166 RepID=A0A1D1UIG5_RAMVA|nr:hypothetical protein RvY_00252-2 [Ramazzottius varieornatus]
MRDMHGTSWTSFLLQVIIVRSRIAMAVEGLIRFQHHQCPTGEFPCTMSSKCLAQRYWCDEIKDCPEGDDEDVRYCGEKTSGFGRHFLRRIADASKEDGCMAPEPLMPPGTVIQDHVGQQGVKCFVKAFPKRCTCMVNRVRCDNLSLTQIFTFTNETADPEAPIYSFVHNRIQFIQEDTFRMLPNMRHLDFRQNSISGLNVRAFNGLSRLRRLHLDQNKLSRIDPRVFWPLKNLCFLWLGHNVIQNWEPHSFNNTKLRWLDLKSNKISLEPGMFDQLRDLYYLELEKNVIRSLTKAKLAGLSSLLYLDLSDNVIERCDEDTFVSTPNLEELSLSNNSLMVLPEKLFAPLHNLQFLNMSHNPGIKSLPMDIFKGLNRLDRLNLSGILISNIHREMFDDIPNNALVIFSKFHYCYYAAHIVDCYPKSDGISSSENLIELTHTRTLMWVLIAIVPLANLFVLLARCCIQANEPLFEEVPSARFHRHDMDVMCKLLCNVFGANALMAAYLLIIALYDIHYRENYHRVAYEWLHGFACQAAGMLGK